MKKRNIFGLSSICIVLLSGCSSNDIMNIPTNFYKTDKKAAPSNNNIQPYNEILTNDEIKERNQLPKYIEPSLEKKELFNKDFKEIALKTKTDAYYQRIGLNTPEIKQWFKKITYLLWNRDISKSEYVREGLKKFPNNKYEFEFVANNISSSSVKNRTSQEKVYREPKDQY